MLRGRGGADAHITRSPQLYGYLIIYRELAAWLCLLLAERCLGEEQL